MRGGGPLTLLEQAPMRHAARCCGPWRCLALRGASFALGGQRDWLGREFGLNNRRGRRRRPARSTAGRSQA